MIDYQNKKIPKVLITGGAGFVGFHTAVYLKTQGCEVHISDIMNQHQETHGLKLYRRSQLFDMGIPCIHLDINEQNQVMSVVQGYQVVIHLAAKPGVAYSSKFPSLVMQTNVVGTQNIMNACQRNGIEKLMYASSSSVYGNGFNASHETQNLASPLSYYAASKRSNELAADVFNANTGIPVIGMRFFTVYGPGSRPDMACWLFAEAISKGQKFKLNGKNTMRDFTYCQDIAKSIYLLMTQNTTGHELVNVGSGSPQSLISLVNLLSQYLNKPALWSHQDLPHHDPVSTHCNTDKLKKMINFVPNTTLSQGVENFVNWYQGAVN